jgi:Uma2 family endonuclease
MNKRITLNEYFSMPETNRPMELLYGYVREPPSPFGDHQSTVFRIAALLDEHVREAGLGRVFTSPLDVVLDRDADLVVQPDALFISTRRLEILRGHVWGAPDLVVEVTSPSTAQHDRTLKLAWYRRYGVKEYWLVHQIDRRIEVVDCESDGRLSFTGDEKIRSKVLRGFGASVNECFE